VSLYAGCESNPWRTSLPITQVDHPSRLIQLREMTAWRTHPQRGTLGHLSWKLGVKELEGYRRMWGAVDQNLNVTSLLRTLQNTAEWDSPRTPRLDFCLRLSESLPFL